VTVRAVFVDAGNTIVGLDYTLIAERIGAEGHAVSATAVRVAEERARVRLDRHFADRSTEGPDVFQLYFRYLLEGLDIPWGEEAERMAGDLRTTEPFGLWSVAIPEAPAVLEGLRRQGLRLAVVSNSNGTVAEILHAVGLAPYFDAILDSAVVGFEKPDPRIFRHAAAALGVRAEEAVHVGDLYSVDVLGARSAGCRAILLDPSGAWPPTDCPKAADLAAAARLIEAMASG